MARIADESATELATIVRRLTALGATPDEIDTLQAGWDDFDGVTWTPEIRYQFVRSPDPVLITELACIREEYRIGTRTEAEDELDADTVEAGELVQVAHGLRSSSIYEVTNWVGADRARAAAMLSVETSTDGSSRKTLIPVLEAVAGGVRV